VLVPCTGFYVRIYRVVQKSKLRQFGQIMKLSKLTHKIRGKFVADRVSHHRVTFIQYLLRSSAVKRLRNNNAYYIPSVHGIMAAIIDIT